MFHLVRVDAYTITIAIAIVGLAAMLIMFATSGLVALGFLPFLGFSALMTDYLARELGVTITTDRGNDIIILITIGTIVGFIFTLGLIQVLRWATEIRRPVANGNPRADEVA
jgi:hypothetical protein